MTRTYDELPPLALTQDTALRKLTRTHTYYGWPYTDGYGWDIVWSRDPGHPQHGGRGHPESMDYDEREFSDSPYRCAVTMPTVVFGGDVHRDISNALTDHLGKHRPNWDDDGITD